MKVVVLSCKKCPFSDQKSCNLNGMPVEHSDDPQHLFPLHCPLMKFGAISVETEMDQK